jgi:hypothetical protein
MKALKLIAGILMLISLNGCKTFRDLQKHSSRADSTATSSKEVTKETTLLQQRKKNRMDSSHTSEQNKYQRQTVSYQFATDANNKGNVPALLPSLLEQRLTGITVITGKRQY